MRLITFLAGTALACSASFGVGHHFTAPAVLDLPSKPCASDDATDGPCYWDAGLRGNGKGRSFWVDSKGDLTYLAPDTAAKPQAWKPFRDVEGHHNCQILVGPTSYVRCADGFTTES